MKKKNAFTLAEVLITLGVIGIVAAMTLPILIANYQKQVAVTAVKKMYSELNQALNLTLEEYGVPMLEYIGSIGGTGRLKFFSDKYIVKYLNKLGECNTQEECYGDKEIKYLRGDKIYNPINYIIKMSDGSYLGLQAAGNGGVYFWYDLNGPKNPNTVGKDIFLFYYFPTILYLDPNKDTGVQAVFKTPKRDNIYAGYHGYIPSIALTRDKIINGNGGGHYGCNQYNFSAYSGSMCSALILMDGKISKDYPW